jgi:enoyl-CoA hydratase/carnithine racemase
MSDDVVVDELRDPGIALLTLNRPERLNAWYGELAVRHFELLDKAGRRR